MSELHNESSHNELSEARRVEMQAFDGAEASAGAPFLRRQLDLIRGVKVKVSVTLGGAELSVGRLFDLKSGEVVTLDRRVNELLDLTIDGKLVGRGELVAVGDNLGLRLVEIVAA